MSASPSRSANIDYLSPQLYSSGAEEEPEYEAEDPNRNVAYERYKNSKAKFVPSIASADQVDRVRLFFQVKGIQVDGYVEWKQVSADTDTDSDDCVAHGICRNRSAGS